MNITDMLLSDDEKKLLAGMLDKTLERYWFRKEPANNGDVAWEAVGLKVDSDSYVITNSLRPAEYFGKLEDITVFAIEKGDGGEAFSWLSNQCLNEYALGQPIEDILLYEDTEIRIANGKPDYGKEVTSSIVFKMPTTVLVIHKVWEYDEMMDIWRGPGALKKIPPVDKHLVDAGDIVLGGETNEESSRIRIPDAESPDSYEVSRKVISLRDWAKACK